MIEVVSLTKSYAKTQAIKDLSFSVAKGSLTGLLGPNGAGKTTTMRIMCGALRPDLGLVKINGINVEKNPIHIKKIIGYLPETPPLYTELKVREQLTYSSKLKGIKNTHIKDKVNDAVKKCGLLDVKDKTIGTLSKGFKQRVGLAQAMINEPEVLVLDEPTIGLDPIQVIEIRDLIKSMSKHRTVILSSHILSEVQMICDDIVILNNGRLVMSAPCKDIINRTLPGDTYEITASNITEDIISRISSVSGIFSCNVISKNKIKVESSVDKDLAPVISRIIVESGRDLIEIKKTAPSLEEVFVKLTSSCGGR